MRTLEVRRHTMRTRTGQHLTQAGVELARRVGNTLGPFKRVVTSTLPRAFETAIAMGFAVDEQVEQLAMMGDEVAAVVQWNAGFAAWARASAANAVVAMYARNMADAWRSIVRAVPENGAALIVSHGGIVEGGTIGCLPPDVPVSFGSFCNYCEGVRLSFDGHAFVNAQVLRVE